MDKSDINVYDLDMDTGLQILTGGRADCDSSWNTREIWNDVVKLYAPLSGSAWIELGEARTQLTPGRCYVIPPYTRLSYAATPALHIDYLHFRLHSPAMEAQLTRSACVHNLPPDFAKRWRTTRHQIQHLRPNASAAETCHLHGLLLDALGYALADGTGDATESPEHARLLPALQYMDDHVTEAPPLADLASRASCSPEHFHRLFVASFGTTPFAYLLRRRLARARQMLAEGSRSVQTVAADCGYHDPGYFSRVFHRHYGYRPSDVRRGARPARP